ncbi:hypothetical protein D3C72_900370 [compost metagenome]
MKFIKELSYRQKGHMGQYEDWRDLFQNEDGTFVVRHKWDHVSVGTGKTDSGEEFEEATQADVELARKDPEAWARLISDAD